MAHLTYNQKLNLALGEAIQRAAGELPEGWILRIVVEKGSGIVELEDPDGIDVQSSVVCEFLYEEVNEAIDVAKGVL